MTWEQSGYGIYPFQDTKAPQVNIYYDKEKGETIAFVTITEIINSKETEAFANFLFDAGKEFFNPPILEESTVGKCDLEMIMQVRDELQETFLKTFDGIKVRQDSNLKGNDYYCAVSPEIFSELKSRIIDDEKKNSVSSVAKKI